MADDEIYNPNANVPLWVNIVIPIISVVIFVYIFILTYGLVLLFLPFRTNGG